MRTEVIITQVKHYDMEGNKGLSVHVKGDFEKTNNKFGVSFPEASVSDTNELAYLQRFADDLPAKFKANFQLTTVKATNGKEKSGLSLSNLEFVNTVEFVDKKTVVKA